MILFLRCITEYARHTRDGLKMIHALCELFRSSARGRGKISNDCKRFTFPVTMRQLKAYFEEQKAVKRNESFDAANSST